MSVYEIGLMVGGGLFAAGVLLLCWSRRRLRAEQVAEYGPARVRGGLYRSREVKAGGHRG